MILEWLAGKAINYSLFFIITVPSSKTGFKFKDNDRILTFISGFGICKLFCSEGHTFEISAFEYEIPGFGILSNTILRVSGKEMFF